MVQFLIFGHMQQFIQRSVNTMITSLDHIAVAVASINKALQIYRGILGFKVERIREVHEQGVKTAMLKAGETTIELLEPLDKESVVAKFLEKRGEGLHHIALRVTNIEKELERLKAEGIILIDEEPRTGVEDAKIAFLHPKSTSNVLIELVEP